MSNLDPETVPYLASLSRIALDEEETSSLHEDLLKILELMDSLQEIDTEGVEPTLHVFPDLVNVDREDEVGETLDRKTFLDNSPNHTSAMVRVPTILA